nr:hypothetical protein [Tanacetum cinerariifolium]
MFWGSSTNACTRTISSMAFTVLTILQAVEATDDSLAVPEHTTIETPMNMSLENKAHFLEEKKAIHLILTRIGDDIYSTEFGKFTSLDGESMESYYIRFYKLMNEMIRKNLTVTTMQVNVQFLQQLQPEWSRFVTIVKQQHKLDEVSYHKLVDILKQYQNEVNELRAEKLARNANPLALIATAQADRDQYYQTSRSHRSSAPSPKPSIPSRSHMTTRHKVKEIAKPITPPSETAFEEDRQFRNQRMECRKPKRVKDSVYHKEKMLLCKQAEQGVPLQAEQYDWLADMDEEVDEQEVEAHYSYMAKIQEQSESVNNTCLVEMNDSNFILDSPDMCEDDIQNEQNDVESDDERVALANLIANLKLDVDENKKIQKQLKKANTTLAQELKECKAILAETSKSLGESICVRDSFLVALQTKQAEFKKYKALMTVPLTMTNLNSDSLKFVHELKQEMHADLKYVESLEKEIDELESDKAEFSNMYDVILQECVSKDVMCSYLQSLSDLNALAELQCMYLHKVKECDCLAQKLSKQTESVSKKRKSVPKANVSEGLSKPVTAQTSPQTTKKAVRVNHNTNVSKPQLKSNCDNLSIL